MIIMNNNNNGVKEVTLASGDYDWQGEDSIWLLPIASFTFFQPILCFCFFFYVSLLLSLSLSVVVYSLF